MDNDPLALIMEQLTKSKHSPSHQIDLMWEQQGFR